MDEGISTNIALLPIGYSQWRQEIEQLISVSKLHTAISVNSNTLSLYWKIGKQILEKQKVLSSLPQIEDLEKEMDGDE